MKVFGLVLSLFFSFAAFATDNTVLGRWTTIDDETGKPKSIVEISQAGDTFHGKIVQLINPQEPEPTCKKCEGEKAGKPIMGLEIIWDIKETKANEEWGGGKILDPENGKAYKCRLRLKEKGQKLEVRGYIGFSLIGRSQTWLRELSH